MWGFLFWCLSNVLIFEMFDEDINCDNCPYIITIRSLLITSTCIFVIVYSFCLSPVFWVYLAETLPPRALGIATWVHWLTKFSVFYSSYFLVLASTDWYHAPTEFNISVSFMFFLYNWFCIVGYFVILVFVQETKGLTKKKIKKVYDEQCYDTIARSLLKSSQNTANFDKSYKS